jgi:hypothetical protein
MTDVLIEAGTLLANAEERTVSGLLVPFGEIGTTNLGKFAIAKGTAKIPTDHSIVTLNVAHDRSQPVGRATLLAEEEDGIHGTFNIAKTEEGDQLLAEIAAGKRSKLSVEMKNIVLRAGQLVSGAIFGAAAVEKGAFPSAALMAEDAGDTTEHDVARLLRVIAEVTAERDAAVQTPTNETPAPAGEKEPTVGIPNTLEASAPAKTSPITVTEIGALMFAAKMGTLDAEGSKKLEENNGNALFATLSDVAYDGTGGLAPTMGQPQWLGEIWNALTYRQQVLPLFEHKDLNAINFAGFKWTTKPAGGDWAGNKSAVPSNTLVVAPVTGTAVRYAIGHDIAREFLDFNTPGFFESYAAAVSEDYARWADGKVATAAVAGATTLAGDALTTLPGPTGGTIGSAASAIIDGATALVLQGTLPTFALVGVGLWKQLVKSPATNVLGYLNAALGLSEGDLEGFVLRPSASVATNKVLVGAKQAVSVFELPRVPIRVDALDLAKGGIDKAAFGYLGVNVNDALGLRLVTAATS